MQNVLNVYLYGKLVGRLKKNEDGQITFSYHADWLGNNNAIPLSQSLPLNEKNYAEKECYAFFEGLLPEGESRQTIAHFFKLSEKNYYGLLHQIGEECAGALTILPDNENFVEPPGFIIAAILSEDQLNNKINALPTRPLLAGEQGIRISLAGVQNKLPVLKIGDEIHLPEDHTPSTHIIKPAIAKFEKIIENEFFCMLLAKKMRLDVAQVEIKKVKSINVLIVKRYDREIIRKPNEGIKIKRIHQEDFCQAQGIYSRYKYQKEGGPSIADCFKVIDEATATPAKDRQAFLKAVFYNYLIGNNDAHGKNFSLLYTSDQIHMAPLYDLLSTTVYSGMSELMAMAIGDKYKADRVYKKHWEEMSKQVNINSTLLIKQLKAFALQLKNEAIRLEEELKEINVKADIFEKIIKIINYRVQHVIAYK